MKTWTLTIASTNSSGYSRRAIIGADENTDQAREQLLAAAAAVIAHSDVDERPRYILQLGDQLVAIIQTGDDELGVPDHCATAELLEAIAHTSPNPFGR